MMVSQEVICIIILHTIEGDVYRVVCGTRPFFVYQKGLLHLVRVRVCVCEL